MNAYNQYLLDIDAISNNLFLTVIPEYSVVQYTNALLTPTDKLFVQGRLINATLGISGTKKIPALKKLYLFIKFYLFKKVQKSNDTFLFAHHGWGVNYYHWFCECLPRFFCMSLEIPHGIALMPSYLQKYPFVIDSLTLLGIKYKIIDSKYAYLFPKLASVRSRPAFLGNIIPDVQVPLRDLILTKLKLPTVEFPGRKIFISRAKATSRLINNENEIFPILSARGYELVYSEDMSLKEQIKIFSESSSVVSLHGAGLTNIMYMRPGSKIMEIRSNTWAWDSQPLCYLQLANLFDLKWTYFHATVSGQRAVNFENFDVDVTLFRKNFELFDQAER